ncbi:MAG: hypothetical protein KGM42_16455, partial [Hyphomicrobiales bacterium]|nr:hypothetical protein [Hyphomicrobiales bacterium]
MGSASTFLSDKPLLGYAVAAILILLGLALVAIIYRALRGNRIRSAAPRGRQQRLGVVDTHDIGGDRQLIIVRRDNVEHLIMTGGPNDVVIESAIVRAELRGRERDAPGWSAGEGETRGPGADVAAHAPDEPAPAPVAAREAPKLPDLFDRVRRRAAETRSEKPALRPTEPPPAVVEPPAPVEDKTPAVRAEEPSPPSIVETPPPAPSVAPAPSPRPPPFFRRPASSPTPTEPATETPSRPTAGLPPRPTFRPAPPPPRPAPVTPPPPPPEPAASVEPP